MSLIRHSTTHIGEDDINDQSLEFLIKTHEFAHQSIRISLAYQRME